MLVAACFGGVRSRGAAPGVPLTQASEVCMPCCRVLSVGWFHLIQDLDTSLIVFLRVTCSGLGPSEGGIVYGLAWLVFSLRLRMLVWPDG